MLLRDVVGERFATFKSPLPSLCISVVALREAIFVRGMPRSSFRFDIPLLEGGQPQQWDALQPFLVTAARTSESVEKVIGPCNTRKLEAHPPLLR